MPRCAKMPYTCPRCNYTTASKGHMHFHLYELRKPCPKTHSDVELTEEIKEDLLVNRIYRPPKKLKKNLKVYRESRL